MILVAVLQVGPCFSYETVASQSTQINNAPNENDDLKNNHFIENTLYISNVLGCSLIAIYGSDFLITKSQSSNDLVQVGVAMFCLPFIYVAFDEGHYMPSFSNVGNTTKQVLKNIVGISTYYSVYSLSRRGETLSGVLFFSAIALSNNNYSSRENSVAGVFCLSGGILNQLLPRNWDQNGVLLSNTALYVLIDNLYPKEIGKTQAKPPEDQGFSLQLTPVDTRVAWNYVL